MASCFHQEDERRRKYVRYLLSLLVCQTVRKAKLDLIMLNYEAIIERLLSPVLARIRFTEFEVSYEIADDLIEVVLMDLLEQEGNIHVILNAMMSQEFCDVRHIVKCFTRNLLMPKSKAKGPSFVHSVKSCLKDDWPCRAAVRAFTAALWIYRGPTR
ncbi:hypothetical protein Q8A73_020187 [Channa argus]|nr:hypothetical protein Q8A73_020187 [Channa argus]